jgi:uncharacterized protein (DUF302 family)
MASINGLISQKSAHDARETARRFRAAAEQAGLTVFAEVDHGRNAAEAGLALGPCIVLLFGNPRAGTLLMQLNPQAGIDLPFKVLAWTDETGDTWLGWNDPQWVADRHGLGSEAQATVSAIAAGMDRLAAAATV